TPGIDLVRLEDAAADSLPERFSNAPQALGLRENALGPIEMAKHQDLSRVSGEVLENVIVEPAHVDDSLGAVRTRPFDLPLEILVGLSLRDLLEVAPRSEKQPVEVGNL